MSLSFKLTTFLEFILMRRLSRSYYTTGTFSGNDSGTWNAEIFSNGNINAELFSSIYNNSFSANGVVDNSGNVNLTFGSTSTGAVFTGQFSNSSASGTWTNESLSYYGTWSGGLAE